MSAPGPLRLDELDRLLKAVDPGVLLVPPRLLRRIIKHDRQLPGIGLHVPHRKTYVCDRERLRALVEADELPLPADLPATLILLAGPDAGPLAELPRDNALMKYWRLLFHARAHLALEPQIGRLSDEEMRGRIERLGRAEFEEVRSVLRQEEFLLPPADDRSVYVEFAALYLDLRHFSPILLFQYFPGIDKPAAVDALLAEDVDVQALLAATRPAGAPQPQPENVDFEVLDQDEAATDAAVPPVEATPRAELTQEAQGAAAVGNLVRAARLRMRAGDEAAALAHLHRLAHRLQSALQLHPAEADAWRRLLPALLPAAARGLWPAAARILYDLQKVCMDHEKAVYKLDLVEWALSLGGRPIKRLLPGQQEVQALRHLRSALKRLPTTRLADADRRELAGLLVAAIHHSEDRLRERFRPVLLGALEDVGLRPHHLPERVARHKLVEELLDRIAEHGFIHIGDLRDALSRNQLKLPDLAGPGEFWHGDALLRLDQRLGAEMEGAYRRGEVYMRWLQRFSAVSFGTRAGRFLTRYVALPFGGAFVLLEGVQHVVEPLSKLFAARTVVPVPEELPEGWEGVPSTEVPVEVHETASAGIHLLHWWSLLLIGFFLLGLLYAPAFRARVVAALIALFHGLRLVLFDLPARVVQLPWVQRVLHSRWVTAGWQYVLKPVLVASVLTFVALAGLSIVWPPFLGSAPRPGAYAWLIVIAALSPPLALVLNSRLGKVLQERFADQLEGTWQHLLRSALPGLFYGILDFFRYCVEAFDRVIYTVDERLRFRVGDSRLSLVIKPVLGLFWFAVAYVARFAVNLLFEPQINPIKHFPVVTVSHKLVLTMGVPNLAHLLVYTLDMELPRALAIATGIGFLIPGIFGFLVWELKENWKLYRANRSPSLKPAAVGSHGETLARLLRPGFHSGTVPKLYGKLRRAGRRARRRGRWVGFRKHRDALHHVEESVHHFIERELLQLLEESKSWGGLHVSTGSLMLSTNRIRVELHCPDLARTPVRITFTERLGVLLASVDQAGWLTHLKSEQRRALTVALAGLYKLGGVDDVEKPGTSCPFAGVVIPWEEWVEAWDADEVSKGLPEQFPGGECLPCAEERTEAVIEVPVG